MYKYWLISMIWVFCSCKSTDSSPVVAASTAPNFEVEETGPVPGAELLPRYVPQLNGKKVGIVVNQSSLVRETHLLDTLKMLSIDVTKIFVPEHGFRGKADAGAHIKDGKDAKSGLPIVSLYGKNKKPSNDQLDGLDIILFDLQDVGVRCYTYISTLHYVMEACAEAGVKIIVLDRPNPNGHYVDGPVLDPKFKSFVGMHPVAFVHGMTIGEYAKMIQGEKWINQSELLELEVIPVARYNHQVRYPLPVPPSPNLPTFKSVLLYPSLVFFEGTTVSVGRGTDHPFEQYGHPNWGVRSYAFKPTSREGATSPKHQDKVCLGVLLSERDDHQIRQDERIRLDYIIQSFGEIKDDQFFLKNNFIDKLAGTDTLRKQIIAGKSEKEIRDSWANDLEAFKKVRKKYLMYD